MAVPYWPLNSNDTNMCVMEDNMKLPVHTSSKITLLDRSASFNLQGNYSSSSSAIIPKLGK